MASETVLQVTSIAQFVSTDFSSVMSSATSFNSVQALESTLLVVETFAGLWLGMAVLLFVVDELRNLYKIRKSAEERKSSKVCAAPDSKNVEELINQYLNSFYPDVFSDTPRMHRLLHEILHNHSFIQMLAWDQGFKKWVEYLQILTNLTANSECKLDQYFNLYSYFNCRLSCL